MTKNVMPSAADFDAWTQEDEEKALEASAERMKVKHLIKDGSVWFLAPHGHIYKLPLNLSIDDSCACPTCSPTRSRSRR